MSDLLACQPSQVPSLEHGSGVVAPPNGPLKSQQPISRKPGRTGNNTPIQQIVQTTKTYITDSCNNALAYAIQANKVVNQLGNIPHADNVDTKLLEEADTLLLNLHGYTSVVENLQKFIDTQFEQPVMTSCPDKYLYEADALTALTHADTDRLLMHMKKVIIMLQQELQVRQPLTTRHNSDIHPVTEDKKEESDNSSDIDIITNAFDELHNLNGANKDTIVRTKATGPLSPTNPPSSGNLSDFFSLQVPTSERSQAFTEALKQKEKLEMEFQKLRDKDSELDRIIETEQHIALEMRRQSETAYVPVNRAQDPLTVHGSNESCSPLAAPVQPPTSQHPTALNPYLTASRLRPDHTAANVYLIIQKMVTKQQEDAAKTQRLLQHLEDRITHWERSSTQPPTRATSIAASVHSEYEREYEQEFGAVAETSDDEIYPKPKIERKNRSSNNIIHPQIRHPSGVALETLLKYLKKYDGTGDLRTFQNAFESVVMEHPSLSNEIRYLILTDHLEGEAQTCIAKSQDAGQAIEMTFNLLWNSRDNEDSKLALLRKLSELRFHQTDPRQMRLDVAAHMIIADQLCDKGLAIYDERTYHPLAGKLPLEMRKSVARYINSKRGKLTYKDAHEFILSCIDGISTEAAFTDSIYAQTAPNSISTRHASINHTNSSANNQSQQNNNNYGSKSHTRAYNPAEYTADYIDPLTNIRLEGYYRPGPGGVNLNIITRSFPFKNTESFTCSTCDGPHHSMRCPLSSSEFRETAKKRGLCPICNLKHRIEKCKARFRCGYCDGLHHMGGCPWKEHYRNPNNYPKEALPVVKYSYDQKKSSSQ